MMDFMMTSHNVKIVLLKNVRLVILQNVLRVKEKLKTETLVLVNVTLAITIKLFLYQPTFARNVKTDTKPVQMQLPHSNVTEITENQSPKIVNANPVSSKIKILYIVLPVNTHVQSAQKMDVKVKISFFSNFSNKFLKFL